MQQPAHRKSALMVWGLGTILMTIMVGVTACGTNTSASQTPAKVSTAEFRIPRFGTQTGCGTGLEQPIVPASRDRGCQSGRPETRLGSLPWVFGPVFCPLRLKTATPFASDGV